MKKFEKIQSQVRARKKSARSFMINSKNRRNIIEDQVQQFLAKGGAIEDCNIPEDLSFYDPEINTYLHKEYLKENGFKWDVDRRVWIAPNESAWLKAQAHCLALPNYTQVLTGISTAEKRTKRSGGFRSPEIQEEKE